MQFILLYELMILLTQLKIDEKYYPEVLFILALAFKKLAPLPF